MNHNTRLKTSKDGEASGAIQDENRYWLARDELNAAILSEEEAASAFDDAQRELAFKRSLRYEREAELWEAFTAAVHTVLEGSTPAQVDLVNRTIDTLWDAADPARSSNPGQNGAGVHPSDGVMSK